MKPPVPILILPALVAAEHALTYSDAVPLRVVEPYHMTASPSTAQSIPTITPEPTAATLSPGEYHQLPHQLQEFIASMQPKTAQQLELRQQAAAAGGGGVAGGGVAAGGGVPVVVSPTQVSPTTIYDIGDGQVTYIQTFKSPPDQWASQSAGTIGLGTLSGSSLLGKVKTYSNPAEPTKAPDRFMCALLAGGAAAAMML